MPATDGEFGQAKVYRRQGATELTVTSGGRIQFENGGLLNVTDTGAVVEFAAMSRGYIPLPIMNVRLKSTDASPGGQLTSATVPTITKLSTGASDFNPVVTWSGGGSSGASAAVLWAVSVPPDWDTATGWSVNLWGDKTSGNEAAQFRVGVNINGTASGTTGGNASAAPTSAQALMTFNVTSGQGVAIGSVLNVAVQAETNASASLRLHSAHIDYKRKNQ